jgi:hypothetical protein
MALLLIVVILATYAIALVASYRRWHWFGPPLLAFTVMLGVIVWGTIEWRQPHTDAVRQPTAFADWQCHSLPLVPTLLLFTAVGVFALVLVRAAAPRWHIQLIAVGASYALAFWPAALLLLYVGVGLLGCDTL